MAPSSATEAVACLSTCLALVKPVGMSQDDTAAWLGVAAQEVQHLPLDLLESACREARRTCTHHAQIIPAIIKASEERLAYRRTIHHREEVIPKERRLAAPEPWQPTREELDALKAAAAASLSARR